MKLIIGVSLFIVMTAQSFAYTMNDIEGKYRVSSKLMPFASILNIDNKGNIYMVEELKRFSCKGKSKLVSDVINAEIKCKNLYDRLTFKFAIDLSKVADLNLFTAPLNFPMIGETLWQFERLDD